MSTATARSVKPRVPSAGGQLRKTAPTVPSQGEWPLSPSCGWELMVAGGREEVFTTLKTPLWAYR